MPCLQLQRINAFSGELSHAMARVPGRNEVLFMAGCNAVAVGLATQQQRFFQGHSENLSAFASSGASSELEACSILSSFELCCHAVDAAEQCK